jgi:hypothetical protein
MDEDEPYAYVIMSAVGYGTYEGGFEDDWPGHDTVINCLPEAVKQAFFETEKTDDGGWCEVPMPETKWGAVLTKSQWEEFRDSFSLNPDTVDNTMGMMFDIGMMMWALADHCDGSDWNMGGITPVSFVQTYFCCQDEDMMRRAGIDGTPDE